VVDEVALEGEGRHQEIVLAGLVDAVASIEFAVFGEMDSFPDRDPGSFARVFAVSGEEFAIVGDGEMNVLVGGGQAVNEEGGNVGEAASLGSQAFGIDGEFLGNIGDLGGDKENPGSFPLLGRWRGWGGSRGRRIGRRHITETGLGA
jgi:hypothetical protein